MVKKCTLNTPYVVVRYVSYGIHSYCMIFKGIRGQNEAMDECEALNARLPLPKNKGEAERFRSVTGKEHVWIGIRD